MNRWIIRVSVVLLVLFGFPVPTPAPFVYTPGEGWSYEPVGEGGDWQRTRAQAQFEVSQQAFDAGKYRLAYKAARGPVKVWPLSDYAPKAQYLMGRSREARRQDKLAFEEYQKVIDQFPQVTNFEEILERQFAIANRFLGGQRFKLWGYIPSLPSMEKTVKYYESVIGNGPFSDVAPQAQMNIGQAWENKRWDRKTRYTEAAKAYEKAADRYHDQETLAANARFKAGLAYTKQANTSEYDQNVSGQAIDTFTDFIALYPDDDRVVEGRAIIAALREEQARGSFRIAKFYENKKRWKGAMIYYNDVLVKNPESPYAEESRERIDVIRLRMKAEDAEEEKNAGASEKNEGTPAAAAAEDAPTDVPAKSSSIPEDQ